ncbi:phage tail tip lysozyme, partial [Staphylococcus aureus]|nr:phage tail tip lysozyme [Staphylococcus aureus]
NAKKASGESNRGFGLVQLTFERHTQLVEYGEKKNNCKWWTMEIQLKFMIEADSGAEALKEVGKNSTDDPGENALSFHD